MELSFLKLVFNLITVLVSVNSLQKELVKNNERDGKSKYNFMTVKL